MCLFLYKTLSKIVERTDRRQRTTRWHCHDSQYFWVFISQSSGTNLIFVSWPSASECQLVPNPDLVLLAQFTFERSSSLFSITSTYSSLVGQYLAKSASQVSIQIEQFIENRPFIKYSLAISSTVKKSSKKLKFCHCTISQRLTGKGSMELFGPGVCFRVNSWSWKKLVCDKQKTRTVSGSTVYWHQTCTEWAQSAREVFSKIFMLEIKIWCTHERKLWTLIMDGT